MLRTLVCGAVAAAGLATCAFGYIRLSSNSNTGSPLLRRDNANIAFLVNTSIAPGLANSDGDVMITSGSDPIQALAAAEEAWAGVRSASVRFQPLSTTTLQNDPADGKCVMTIADTAANRSIVGDYLAITVYSYAADNSITDTDIIFNPRILDSNGTYVPFSTDHELNTYDLRSVATHELGHALGANHSGVVGATMNFATSPFGSFATIADATVQSTLSSDDIAFVTDVYPAPSSAAKAGAIKGAIAFSNGTAIPGGLVVALDPSTGATVGGFTSLTDGTYLISPLPPGNYLVYAQPLNGPVTASDLGIGEALITSSFRTTFAGGNLSPWSIAVTDGAASTADINVDPTASDLQITWLGVGSAGGFDWSYAPVKTVTAGYPVDILVWGSNLGAVTESQLRVLGPGVSVVPGTLRIQPSSEVNSVIPLRFTLEISPSRSRSLVSVGLVNGTDAVVRSGGVVIIPELTTSSR